MVRPLLRRGAGGHLRRPLDLLFGAPSHVAILRALAARPAGATGREAALVAGVAPQATLDTLGRLEEAGVIRRLPAGRAYVFSLNRDHDLVRRSLLPLFEEEGAYRERVVDRLRRLFKGRAIAAVLFGSAGRREDRADSDLDVCLLVRNAGDAVRAKERASAAGLALLREFGVRLSTLVFTRTEFQRAWKEKRGVVRDILRDGESLFGPRPEAWV